VAHYRFARQNEGKQRILEILNLEDLSPIYAFAIERSGGVFPVGQPVSVRGLVCSVRKMCVLTMFTNLPE
jgi:hypothetical protein